MVATWNLTVLTLMCKVEAISWLELPRAIRLRTSVCRGDNGIGESVAYGW